MIRAASVAFVVPSPQRPAEVQIANSSPMAVAPPEASELPVAGVARDVHVCTPSMCASDAPRLAGVRHRLAIERSLTAPPEPLRPQSPAIPAIRGIPSSPSVRNRRSRALSRAGRGRCRRLRAERSGVIDSCSNAPGIALGRPRVAEKRPSGSRPAMSPWRPPRPCSCQRLSRQFAALYAQETAPDGSAPWEGCWHG